MPDENLERAIALSRSGKKLEAREILAAIINADLHNETAWLWYADTFPEARDRIAVVQDCLKYNPASQVARKGLETFKAEEAVQVKTVQPVYLDLQRHQPARQKDELRKPLAPKPSARPPAARPAPRKDRSMVIIGGVFVLLILVSICMVGVWVLQSQGLLSSPLSNIFRPAPSQTQTASVFSGTFPFSVGNSWHYVYWVVGSVSDDQPPMQPLMGDYTEQVTQVTTGSREDVHIYKVEQKGDAINPYCYSFGSTPAPMTLWFVTDDKNVYVACDKSGAGLPPVWAESVGAPGSASNESILPDFVLPFRVGSLWGGFPGLTSPDSTDYQWNVYSQTDVSTIAGDFKNCYQMGLYTLPDATTRTVCPGIGLVVANYHHNGTLQEIRIELASYSFAAQP